MKDNMLVVKNLSKYFNVSGNQTLKAVDDVSFEIKKGEILGLVGESGCGKTTLGRTIKNIYKATEGEIIFEGKDVCKFTKDEIKEYARNVQMIFQDPYSSLNPRMTVSEIISEGMVIHNLCSKDEMKGEVVKLLKLVGLNEEHGNRFPHEFSGGQRQRVGIARALALNPKFIVCDEPISALDVSIQAQIVNLFKELQRKMDLTYLFVAHDLSMVKYISDKVAVMYLGKIVEIAPSKELYLNPLHPYTEFLLSAIPIPDPDIESGRKHLKLEGEMPSPMDLPKGCSFQNRCKYVDESCLTGAPKLVEIAMEHYTSCTKAKKL